MLPIILFSLTLSQLPDAPGKTETAKLCSQCHEIERATSQSQDTAGWQQTVDKMKSLGMTGSDAEIRAVISYLAKAFPSAAIPKLNVNTALRIELESVLDLRRSQAEAVVDYRSKNGNFKSLEDLKRVPGIDPAKIDLKKDRLTF